MTERERERKRGREAKGSRAGVLKMLAGKSRSNIKDALSKF